MPKNEINDKNTCSEIKSEKDSKGIFEALCKKKLWKGKINTMKEIVMHECMKRTDFSIIFSGKKKICSKV